MIIPEDTLTQSPPPSDEQPNPNVEDPSHLPKTQTLDPQIHPGDHTQPPEDQIKAVSSRRPGTKRKRVNKKHLEVLQHKIEILRGNLKLIPFLPTKTLDIAGHESLLRRVGLWDFVHVELDTTDLSVDLIAQLVVNYKRQGRVSEVNGYRIRVSRADLGRALRLPAVTKDNSNVMVIGDEDDDFANEKSVQFIEELMANWMLLRDDDDAWIFPEEVLAWIDMIRKGHPDKVEWASLMWFMVEKEISQGIDLVHCFYASHLQCLIKHQNPSLFLAARNENVIMKDKEDVEDVTMVDDSHQDVTTVVSKDCDDEKMALAANENREAAKVNMKDEEEEDVGSVTMVDYRQENAALTVRRDCDDEKMTIAAREECEAEKADMKEEEAEDIGTVTNVIYGQENAALIVSKDCDDEKATLIASEKHESGMVIISVSEPYTEEKIGEELADVEAASANNDTYIISVGESYAEEKIGEELVGVEAASANNDIHMMESVSYIEPAKSNKMDLQNDCVEVKSEDPSVELTLGQDSTNKIDMAQADDVIYFDGPGLGDSDHWQMNESIAEEGPLLRQCSFRKDPDSFEIEGNGEDIIMEGDEDDDNDNDNDNDDNNSGDTDEEEEEENEKDDGAGEEEEMDLFPKFDSLQGISDAHMFQGLGISQCEFGSQLPHINAPPIRNFTSHAETSSSPFGSTKIVETHDQNVSYHTAADGNKRLKRGGTWGHQEPSDFYRCMENIENWMEKAKLMYASKEQECTQMGMNQQLLYEELGRREHMIEQQQKITHEVRQKSQMEIYKLERELFIMTGLLDSYRKALKDTRREFSEYRMNCSYPEEPLYKDAGPGGVVLSVAELEMQRLRQEEEDKMKCLELESTVKNFEAEWYRVFEGHHFSIEKLDERLSLFEEKVKLLKLLPRNQKVEEVTEHPITKED